MGGRKRNKGLGYQCNHIINEQCILKDKGVKMKGCVKCEYSLEVQK